MAVKKVSKQNIINSLKQIEEFCNRKEIKISKVQQIIFEKLARLKNNLKEVKKHQVELSSEFYETKQNIIEIIRKKEKLGEDSTFLKNVVNSLEEMELQLAYVIPDTLKDKDFSLVEHVLFTMKELRYSRSLIENYPYLINAYSVSNENILEKVLVNYVQTLKNNESNSKEKYNLYYYEAILEGILKNKKISVDNEIKKKYLEEIRKLSFKQKSIVVWQKHLINILQNVDNNYSSNDVLQEMYEINEEFSEKSLRDIYVHLETYVPRKQQGNYVFSVDGKDTYNRDDALEFSKDSKGNYDLTVYIADPLAIFPAQSQVIKEARLRNKAIYQHRNTINIFPNDIIINYLSLDRGKRRPARINHYKISPNGEIISFEMNKGTVCVTNNFSYPQFNHYIETLGNNKKMEEQITLMFQVAEKLKNQVPKTIANILKNNQNPASSLIAFYMIFNNYQTAQYFKHHDLPFIYRYQDRKVDLSNFYCAFSNQSDQDYYDHFIKTCEDTLYPVIYSCDKTYHRNLKSDGYGSISNPNRDYASILAHMCQDAGCFQQNTNLDQFYDMLQKEIKYINERNLAIDEYVRKSSQALRRIKK